MHVKWTAPNLWLFSRRRFSNLSSYHDGFAFRLIHTTVANTTTNKANSMKKYPFLCGQGSKSPVLFVSYRPIKQNSDALTTHIFKTLVTFKRICKLYILISWMNILEDNNEYEWREQTQTSNAVLLQNCTVINSTQFHKKEKKKRSTLPVQINTKYNNGIYFWYTRNRCNTRKENPSKILILIKNWVTRKWLLV